MSDVFLAIGGVIGSAIASFSAILLARKEDSGLRKSLIVLAIAGLVASGICAAFQCVGARETAAEWSRATNSAHELQTDLNAANKELINTKKVLDTAANSVDALAQLNALSAGKFYVQLSADAEPCHPCTRARAIDGQFPGAMANQGIRVIDIGKGGERFHLIFGKMLSLAAAGVYQQLAIDHNLANGRPLIENENGSETVVDCVSQCERGRQ